MLKPDIDQEEIMAREDQKDKIIEVKTMKPGGVAINPDMPSDDQFVNHEGLRRVYKPKEVRKDYEKELEKKVEDQNISMGIEPPKTNMSSKKSPTVNMEC